MLFAICDSFERFVLLQRDTVQPEAAVLFDRDAQHGLLAILSRKQARREP